MPNWKKLVVSGSDASLNSLSVTNAVTASFFTGSFTGDGSGLTNLTVDISSLVTNSSFDDFTSSYNTGSFTGSFIGDGSGLTNLDIFNLSGSFLEPVAFVSQSSVTVTHSLDIEYPVVQVYDSEKNQLIPDSIVSIDNNTVQVGFIAETSGHIVVMKGGHVLPSFGTIASTFTNETDITVNHKLDAPSPFVQVYNDDDEQIIPLKVKIVDNDNVQVTFNDPTSGQIVITKGGHIATASRFIESFSGSFTGSLLSQTNLFPSTDNTRTLGTASLRWSEVFAGNAAINTSDATLKQDIDKLNEAEQQVATALKGLIRKYRWISSVEEKGQDARIHVGVMAQDVAQAFEDAGLDAQRYGVFCKDVWHTKEETYTEQVPNPNFNQQAEEGEDNPRMIDGQQQTRTLPCQADHLDATEHVRYGVRYDQLWAFIISAL